MVLDDSVMRRNDALSEVMRFARAVVADGEVTESEAKGFQAWVEVNSDIVGLASMEEVVGILMNVFADGRLTAAERAQLVEVLERFGG